MPMLRQETVNAVSGTNIALGESTLGVTLTVSFELE
jgi:hypothetical protein